VKIYNHQIPQRALKHLSPVQALKIWHKKKPELSKKRVYNQSGLDTWVTYRFRGLHASGLPRFATFVRVRDAADMPAPPPAQALRTQSAK
jgi:hypothetical protein